MSRQTDELVPGEGSTRVLNFRAVRLHNLHLRSGRKTDFGCPVCSEGLEGAVAEIAKRPATEPEVAEGDGVNEEEDPPPPPGSGHYRP